MDKLQAIFITEANDLISDLERALLDFEKDLNNNKPVQEIFRVMHTLKGSASMFGFETLSALTHNLETVYDAIRDGRAKATIDVLEVTLQSLDHLKAIMHDPKLDNTVNKSNHVAILQQIDAVHKSSQMALTPHLDKNVDIRKRTYYIFCKPSLNIFKNGTNPLYLIDDLKGLGDAIVLPHLADTPDLNNIIANACYTSFEVILFTSRDITEIKDVFLFVEDACEVIIERISDDDLIARESFVNALTSTDTLDKEPYGLAIMKAMADSYKVNTISPAQTNGNTNVKNEQGATIRVASEKLDELMNLVSELVTSQARLSLLASQHGFSDLINLSENMDKITRRLRDTTFNICLVPIETLVTRFQRLVRDLAKDLNKEIEFIAEGTETELDRSIIEKVTDPILHILRNCIDHGIELPDERMKNGKPRQGSILFKAYHSGTSVYIQIKDNGKGIDTAKIRSKAIIKGLITEESIITEQEILNLIFAPGFSTAEKITDVSGRGVGMDIVKRNIESIHGEVSIDTRKGEGTTITIKLPLTLSIMDGMLVRIASSDYIVPLTAVDKCFEIETRRLKPEVSQKVVLDGSLLPVFNLRGAFNEHLSSSPVTQIIKLNYDEYAVGITVDAIIGEYQAVMKPLGEMYQSQDEFSGATILGDGSVALVMDTDKLIRQLIKNTSLNN